MSEMNYLKKKSHQNDKVLKLIQMKALDINVILSTGLYKNYKEQLQEELKMRFVEDALGSKLFETQGSQFVE